MRTERIQKMIEALLEKNNGVLEGQFMTDKMQAAGAVRRTDVEGLYILTTMTQNVQTKQLQAVHLYIPVEEIVAFSTAGDKASEIITASALDMPRD